MQLGEIFRFMEGIFDHDHLHQQALDKTGYWGKQAAGSIPYASSTKRFLISHRSRSVQEPGQWGTWGGAIDPGEDPKTGAMRELREECGGFHGTVSLVPLYIYKDQKFRYSNFLAVMENEFTPQPHPDAAWETQGYRWCEFGNWPQPMHFGWVAVLNDAASVATIQKIMAGGDQRKLRSTKSPVDR